MEQHTVTDAGWVLQCKGHGRNSETGPAYQNVWRFMLQVLLREEEDISALHTTGICRTASNGGDLQQIQTRGTCNRGALLWVTPPVPWSAGPRLPLDVRVVGCGIITHTKNKGSIDKWGGLGKVSTGEAPPRSDKPAPFDKSSRGQATSIPPCPTPIWSTNIKLQQGRRV